MNRRDCQTASLGKRVPRASGDEPVKESDERYEIRCSPRQRG